MVNTWIWQLIWKVDIFILQICVCLQVVTPDTPPRCMKTSVELKKLPKKINVGFWFCVKAYTSIMKRYKKPHTLKNFVLKHQETNIFAQYSESYVQNCWPTSSSYHDLIAAQTTQLLTRPLSLTDFGCCVQENYKHGRVWNSLPLCSFRTELSLCINMPVVKYSQVDVSTAYPKKKLLLDKDLNLTLSHGTKPCGCRIMLFMRFEASRSSKPSSQHANGFLIGTICICLPRLLFSRLNLWGSQCFVWLCKTVVFMSRREDSLGPHLKKYYILPSVLDNIKTK